MDVTISFVLLVCLSPVLVLVAVAILLSDGRPIIFRQRRVGANGHFFSIVKFRTMPVDTPEVEAAQAHLLQPTRLGQLLRRLSLDELPQLLNVLSGEMSLVGPRPAIPLQHGLLSLRRANGAGALRPGITGLAQVKAREGMTEVDKAFLDGVYASKANLRTDVAILIQTLIYPMRKPVRV